jgi:hypothetical protein
MPRWKTLSRETYCFALGLLNQKLGEFASFQSCHQVTGSLGMLGLLDQKVPLLP